MRLASGLVKLFQTSACLCGLAYPVVTTKICPLNERQTYQFRTCLNADTPQTHILTVIVAVIMLRYTYPSRLAVHSRCEADFQSTKLLHRNIVVVISTDVHQTWHLGITAAAVCGWLRPRLRHRSATAKRRCVRPSLWRSRMTADIQQTLRRHSAAVRTAWKCATHTEGSAVKMHIGCNCNWGTCIAPPTRRPRGAHHRVNRYSGARRHNETKMFSDHDDQISVALYAHTVRHSNSTEYK